MPVDDTNGLGCTADDVRREHEAAIISLKNSLSAAERRAMGRIDEARRTCHFFGNTPNEQLVLIFDREAAERAAHLAQQAAAQTAA